MSDTEDSRPHPFPVLALVCSTGGLEALTAVLGPLPADFPAAVIALQHLSPARESQLAALLELHTELEVRAAADGDHLRPGLVLVVPAASHLVVGVDGRVRLVVSGSLPPARPSADLLLATVAVALQDRVTAVVLTGAGSDGAVGAQVVQAFGGTVLVQDEATAQVFGMPGATVAAAAGRPVARVGLPDIAAHVQRLLTRPDHR